MKLKRLINHCLEAFASQTPHKAAICRRVKDYAYCQNINVPRLVRVVEYINRQLVLRVKAEA